MVILLGKVRVSVRDEGRHVVNLWLDFLQEERWRNYESSLRKFLVEGRG